MSNVLVERQSLQNVANSIRGKNGQSTTYKPSEMAAAIDAIQTDPSGGTTATNDDVLLGKTAYSNHVHITGTIPTKTDQDITSVGGVVTIPAGYYAQQYTKQGDPTGDATMTSGDQMLSGITAYSKGVKYTGTIPTKTSADLTISGATFTAPSGYYATDATKTIESTTVVEKEGSISGTTYTQGKVTVDTAGFISSGDKVSGSTFANTGTSGTTYKDISATTAAPVLISGDYLYINKGYTDDVKISLARLVPEGASADLSSDKILQGYSAYNNDGLLIAGNIQTKTQADLTVSGDTVNVPKGYFAAATSKAVAAGTQGTPVATKGTVSNNSITVTPSATDTTGYITGETKTGTAVTVSASELVSGSTTITTNTTVDVTNLASVTVNVPIGYPIEVATEAELDSKMTAENEGRVFKFIGETTSKYIKNGIYIITTDAMSTVNEIKF